MVCLRHLAIWMPDIYSRLLVHVMFCLAMAASATSLCSNSALAQEPKLKDVLETSERVDSKDKADNPAEKKAGGPADEYGRGTPRTSFEGLLDALREGDYELGAQYLDLRNLRESTLAIGEVELVRQLKIVLDRGLWVDPDKLSADPRGMQDDGLAASRDSLGRIKVDSGHIDLYLQRVPRADGVLIWKISKETVRELPALNRVYGYGVVGEKLSSILPGIEFMGLQIWQWLLVFCGLGIAYLVAMVPTGIFARLLQRGDRSSRHNLARFLNGPVRLLLAFVLAQSWVDFVRPSVAARAWIEGHTVVTILVVWVLIRLVEVVRGHYAMRLEVRGRKEAVVLTKTIANAVNLFIILVAVMVWLENLGFRATTLIAGLGIGGLAIALATQKPLENLIGAITLLVSAPVRVGDFCRFGTEIGTVEEIGMRATRIRTLGRTAIYIPNSQFAHMQIENISGRDQILYETTVKLRLDTTPDQVRYVLVEIRAMLYSHPMVNPEPARVRFADFGDSSLDLKLYAYITTTDWSDYLGVIEDLNLRIMDIVTRAGTSMAFPTTTVSLEKAGSEGDKAAREAEDTVRDWRSKGELFLPAFTREKISQLRGKLPYPDKGSPQGNG